MKNVARRARPILIAKTQYWVTPQSLLWPGQNSRG